MTFGAIGLAVSAVGVGMSAASAAGAFNGKVDSWTPTPEEQELAKRSQRLFNFGRKIQKPLDAMAKKDLQQLKSPAEYARRAGVASSQVMNQADPAIRNGLNQTAMASGGPGSGRFMAQLGTSGAALESGLTSAQAQGRLSGLQTYMGRSGQYLDRMTDDLNTGMGLMETGATQAAGRQADRINAQVQNNVARNQAMGQIGGALTSVGMGMGSMGSAMGGVGAAGAGGSAGPSMAPAMNPKVGAPYGGYVFANPAL